MRRFLVLVVAVLALYLAARFVSRDHQRISSIADYQPLAERPASSPEDRIQLFIEDWHNWWSATASAVGRTPVPAFGGLRGLNSETGKSQLEEFQKASRKYMQDLEPWSLLEGDVIRRHFVPDEVTDWRGGGFGSPAAHDPNIEKIILVQPQTDGLVAVETQTKQSTLTTWYEYQVVKVNDDWRIQKILHFYDPAEALVCSEGKRKKFEAEIRQQLKLKPIPADQAARCDQLFTEKNCFAFKDRESPLNVVALGAINLQSGIVGVYDFGWASADFRPLNDSVPPGTYEVEIVQTEFTSGDIRNAALRLLLGDPKTVIKWVEACTVDQGNNVVGVDAGNAAIFDGGRFMTMRIRAHERLYDKYVSESSPTRGPYKRYYKLSLTGDSSSTDCVIVDSGLGDGAYPCYWGLDANEKPTVLLVDFRLVRFSSELPSSGK